jgi:acyl-CoA thioester hydrolase
MSAIHIDDSLTKSVWISEVRDYELDFQGIVNNACYFQYMDHARALHFYRMGTDIVKAGSEGIKTVLIESKTNFSRSLKYKDPFHVISELIRISRLKFLFKQKITDPQGNNIYVVSQNICCILSKENKPCVPDALSKIKISKEYIDSKLIG